MPPKLAHLDGGNGVGVAPIGTGEIPPPRATTVITFAPNNNCDGHGDRKTRTPDSIGDTTRPRGRCAAPSVIRVCEHCGKTFSLTAKRAKARRGRFCKVECHYEWKKGRPAPGFVTPDSAKRERIAANGLINKRLRLGWFTRPTRCMKCGEKKPRLDSHHFDYSKPDHVYWLCRGCHMTAHHRPDFLDGIAPFTCTDQRREVENGR